MTTPAEALSSVTDQQQLAVDRERVVEPERQTSGVAETSPGEQAGSADGGQPAVESVDELPGVKPARRDQEASDKQARRRAKNVAASRRYRERHGDAERQRNTEYKKAWRARRRQEQGLPPAVQQQPVLDRQAELERQLAEAQAQLAQHDAKQRRQRELKNEWQRGYRERHLEAVRQRDAEYRRKRRARERGENPAQ